MKNALYYRDYLGLEQILNSQHPESFKEGYEPAHDEMLFIIIHQAYELWFKQILFELDYAIKVFSKEVINDNSEDLNLVRHRLNRVCKILSLLNQQVHVLDTMTPLDFLAFRNLLTPASGFQSKQFRLIEAKLGLQMDHRHAKDYYKRTNEGGFETKDLKEIETAEVEANLLQLINNWLERMPFFKAELWDTTEITDAFHHPFWQQYNTAFKNSLSEIEQTKLEDYINALFNNANQQPFSALALRAALFIMLYRDYPMFQTSYQILDMLIEIDHLLSSWRHNHFIMVRRMIGLRVGTGNTSGAGYLEGAMSKHYIYKDLSALATYLIPRNKAPQLPKKLIERLGFYEY